MAVVAGSPLRSAKIDGYFAQSESSSSGLMQGLLSGEWRARTAGHVG
jgi:hypothetical protein